MGTCRDASAPYAGKIDGGAMAAIKATPRRMGIAKIHIPGERSYATRARLLREGIEIDRLVYEMLGTLHA